MWAKMAMVGAKKSEFIRKENCKYKISKISNKNWSSSNVISIKGEWMTTRNFVSYLYLWKPFLSFCMTPPPQTVKQPVPCPASPKVLWQASRKWHRRAPNLPDSRIPSCRKTANSLRIDWTSQSSFLPPCNKAKGSAWIRLPFCLMCPLEESSLQSVSHGHRSYLSTCHPWWLHGTSWELSCLISCSAAISENVLFLVKGIYKASC